MPSLRSITPAAAEVLASGPHAIYLGLTVLDDPAVARDLTKSPRGQSAEAPRGHAGSHRDLEQCEVNYYAPAGFCLRFVWRRSGR